MNNTTGILIPMLKLSKQLDSIRGKINKIQTIADRYLGDFEHWSNRSLLLQSLSQMAKKINALLDQLNRMQSNQDLLNDANFRQQMKLMQNSMQLMNNSFHDLAVEVQLIQQDMTSIKQYK